MNKRASISQLSAREAAISEARVHAKAACDEAESLVRSTSYFELAGWKGLHANAFMQAVSPGGAASDRASAMHAQCLELIESMDAQLGSLRSERSALQSSIARDQCTLNQTRRSMSRMRKAR